MKRTPLKRKYTPIKKISEKGKRKKQEKIAKTKILHEWFLELWDSRQLFNGSIFYCRCEECGKMLTRQFYRGNSCCFSHILAKSSFPELALWDKNLMIVCPDCHALYESGSEKAVNQRERKKELLIKLKEEI